MPPHLAATLTFVALVAALAAAGCGGRESGPPVVLRLEGTDQTGADHNPGVLRFIDRLSQLSHGNVRVNATVARVPGDPHQTGSHDPEDDRTLIRQVAAGKADLAWVGTHSFSTLGVHGFDALDAPMLVDSYGAQSAVLRSDLPAAMLADTKQLGVEGLAVLGGGLARPVGIKRPLIGPEQFRGLRWRVLPSTARDAAVNALGGRPNHLLYPGFMLPIRLLTGQLGAFESDLDTVFFDLVPQTPTAYVTENVRFWPDTSALIANPARLAQLTSKQRDWVEQAADDAQAYSAARANRDAQTVRDLCATGVRFAQAPATTVAALRQSFAPAYAELARDPATRAGIEQIRKLKADVPADPPLRISAACQADHPAPARKGPAVRSTIPDGVYRVRLAPRDVRANYVKGLDVQRYSGTETLRLAGGRWTLEQEGSLGRSTQAGTYSGSPPRTVWTQLEGDGQRVKPPRERRISMTYVNQHLVVGGIAGDLERAWYSAHPWERIG